ncbi:MAG: FKBP-type peptidyl-prolyl cis-trans isomerase [Ferruginibacter sp.]
MKKWFFVSSMLVLSFSACKKDKGCTSLAPTTVASAIESAYLQNYLAANNITASEKNGMYYVIATQGSGTSPNLCSTITVDYVGKFINETVDGAQFDASQPNKPLVASLNNLIAGWQVVLPLIKAGGTVTLYIPPSLGYGAQAQPGLPANSYLKFVLTVKSVN